MKLALVSAISGIFFINPVSVGVSHSQVTELACSVRLEDSLNKNTSTVDIKKWSVVIANGREFVSAVFSHPLFKNLDQVLEYNNGSRRGYFFNQEINTSIEKSTRTLTVTDEIYGGFISSRLFYNETEVSSVQVNLRINRRSGLFTWQELSKTRTDPVATLETGTGECQKIETGPRKF